MTLYFKDPDVELHCGDAFEVLRELPSESVHMAATSPPFFGLRDYGTGAWEGGDEGCDHKQPASKVSQTSTLRNDGRRYAGPYEGEKATIVGRPYGAECGKCGARRIDSQIGLESSPDEWAARLVRVFREARRVLRDDGTLWVEIAESYAANRSLPLLAKSCAFVPSLGHEAPKVGVPTGCKPKDLIGAPWLLAFALRADGWYLRSCIVWSKPNAMPESVTDRPTTAHSYVFLFSKKPRYFYDAEALREPAEWARWGDQTVPKHDGISLYVNPGNRQTNGPKERSTERRGFDNRLELAAGKNARTVWTIPTEPNALAICRVCDAYWQGGAPREHCGEPVVQHFAAFPRELVRRMILAGSSPGGTVLDPFSGSGTTLLVARQLGRHAIGIELNERYGAMTRARLSQLSLLSEPVAERTEGA